VIYREQTFVSASGNRAINVLSGIHRE